MVSHRGKFSTNPIFNIFTLFWTCSSLLCWIFYISFVGLQPKMLTKCLLTKPISQWWRVKNFLDFYHHQNLTGCCFGLFWFQFDHPSQPTYNHQCTPHLQYMYECSQWQKRDCVPTSRHARAIDYSLSFPTVYPLQDYYSHLLLILEVLFIWSSCLLLVQHQNVPS